MLRRCLDKFKDKIPISQAAYQSGRSTTEHVFTLKILAEKAITSEDYNITLLLLDMSKAFDTVRRRVLFDVMEEILDHDELHIIKILVEDVSLRVRINNNIGQPIHTNIGVPQGDCLSPILFIIYLANALVETQHIVYPIPTNCYELQEHDYAKHYDNPLIIDQQYADDIGYVTNITGKTETLRREIPKIIKKRNLFVNDAKTESYDIKRKGNEDWKKCKYLGSLLDTENDIKRRKILGLVAYNDVRNIFESRKISIEVKIRLLGSHIESIFLYNSELWTVTKATENTIDTFQRNIMRKILNIKWPDKISNADLYNLTKTKEWSKKVKKRRLQWFGHLIRLPEDAPAKQALYAAQKQTKKPRGGQKTTWLKTIEKDIQNVNMAFKYHDGVTYRLTNNNYQLLARNRYFWHILVNRAVSL